MTIGKSAAWRFLALVAILGLLVTIIAPGVAAASRCELDATRCDKPVTVVIDGQKLSASPPAFIEDGRVLVPLRALSEALGATVEWDGQTQTVTAYLGQGVHYTRVRIGDRVAKNDYWPYRLDVPARIVSDRTFVPLRFMVEALGASVSWDGATRTATVDSHSQPAPLYTEALELAVRQLVPQMERCAYSTANGEQRHLLCLDPDKYQIEMSPGMFRQVKWYMDAANAVAHAPDFVPKPTFTSSEVDNILQNVALPTWNPTPGYQPTTRVSPSSPLLAVLLGALGLLSGDTPQTQKVIDEAKQSQVNTGYKADSYKPCVLKAGTVIYATTAANRVVKLRDGTKVYAGEGGGLQYFLSDYGTSVLALEGELIYLENWAVTADAWAALVR